MKLSSAVLWLSAFVLLFTRAHFNTIFIFSMFHAELPGPPSHVSILVTSTSSLFVTIKEPEGDTVGLITRYRGREGTRREDFHGGLVEWMGG